MASIFFRVIIIYFILTLFLRIMGKRQVGELELSELVTTLLLSEIAALPIDDPDIPLSHAIVPILLIFSLEVIITYLKTKCNPLKRIFESKPVFIIEKGRINQGELAKNRISIGELLGELRIQGVANINDVYYAILEQNGKLSVVQKNKTVSPDPGLPHVLIADGEINKVAAEHLNVSESAIINICSNFGQSIETTFLLMQDDAGSILFIPKEPI